MSVQFPSPAAPEFRPGAADLSSSKITQKEDEPHLVESKAKEERLEPVFLPPMPEELPPMTAETESLIQAGTALLEMKAPQGDSPERERLSERLENPMSGGSAALEGASTVLELKEGVGRLSELSRTDLGIAAASISGIASSAEIGMSALKLFENNQVIEEAQKQLFSKQGELESLEKQLEAAKKAEDGPKIAALEEQRGHLKVEIGQLTHTIEMEVEKKKEAIEELVANSVKTGLAGGSKSASIASEALKAGSHAAHAATVASGVTGSLLSVVTLALTSKALHENRMLAMKIAEEKGYVQAELKNAKERGDPVMEELLELRLQNLEHQFEENAVSTVRNAVSLTAGILGTAVAAKTVAVAVGATIGVGLGTAVTATGIGAIVLASAALLIGSGYLVYKNRHAIENKAQNAHISIQEFSDSRQIRQLQEEKAEHRQIYEESTQTYQDTMKAEEGLTENIDDFYRGKIEGLSKEIEELEQEKAKLELPADAPPLSKISAKGKAFLIDRKIEARKAEIRELASEKTAIAIGRSRAQIRSQKSTSQSLASMHHTDRKILGAAEDLRVLNTRRNTVNEAYLYGKDAAKFGKGKDGEQMTAKKLGDAHARLYSSAKENPGSTERAQKYFLEQNKRTKSDVKVTGLREGVSPEKFWEFVIQGVTAPVK